ncbi:integration host factor, alpha subunit [Citreicella sp. SE45]|nr:integration host factor, alpha subunit [Citreicella sp. SE45]
MAWHGARSSCAGEPLFPGESALCGTLCKCLILTRKIPGPMLALKPGGTGMSEKTLTRMDLSEAVFREVGLSRNESAELVETVLQHMSDALVEGEQVKISSFGTFSVRDKAARVGRNPKTGEEVPIQPRRVLTFRPSHQMKERVAAGNKG